jgi:Xaa-Pro aminopeptidase
MALQGRIKSLQQELTTSRPSCDAFLITHSPNLCYLCGFTGSAGALIVSKNGATFFSDGRYRTQAREEVRGARIVIVPKSPLSAAADWLLAFKKTSKLRSRLSVGIEAEHVTVAARSRLIRALAGGFRLRALGPLVEQARMIKDPEEVQKIRRAALLGSALFDKVLKAVRPGATESAVAAELEYAARRAGAEAMSFSTIIASGKRSALPHGHASNSAIPPRGFVVCDFGVILASYCSDMTRTIHVCRPTAEARSAYEAVRSAQQAGVEAIKPGVTSGEVDAATRKVLVQRGLGKYFTHSTGHGVGLEIHEGPRLAAGQTEVLRPGMVVTVEPGVYIAGKWGIRIEDMVLVTETGHEVLTPTKKEMIVI